MKDAIIEGVSHRFTGHELTWAGYCPWTDAACFGTEDGMLLWPVGSDVEPEGTIRLSIFEGEAINGVAFSGDLVAISSRSEVRVGFSLSPQGPETVRLYPPFNRGAYGVVARAAGGFIAPLGRGGLLFITCDEDRAAYRVGTIVGPPEDFCKLAPLGSGPDGEVFACAARTSGLIAFIIGDEIMRKPIIGHGIEGIDIVYVCSMRSDSAPRAAVALNRDARLLLTHDVLERRPPLMLGFDDLAGTAYSVHSAHGHIFILTSTELVTLPNLAADFLAGAPMDRVRDTFVMPIQASEAFLVGDDDLFVIAEKRESFMRLADLARGVSLRSGGEGLVQTAVSFLVPSIFQPS